MEMELRLSNDSPLLPSVQAFIRSTLNEVGLPDTTVTGLEQLVAEVVTHTIDHAYPNGEQGAIIIKVNESNGKFELTICDDGVPQDIKKLEADLIQGPIDLPSLRNAIHTRILDEMHWSALGPNGKALHLIKWLHDKSVRDSDSKQVSKDEPLAPEQEYDVRKSRPEEALQISQLIYRIYGNTYFNEDLYYPERVAAQHANGKVLSIVAADKEGYLAGHCALEFNDAGPVAEVGQAAVDPRHRGRGLLNQMKDALDKEAQQMGLVCRFCDSPYLHSKSECLPWRLHLWRWFGRLTQERVVWGHRRGTLATRELCDLFSLGHRTCRASSFCFKATPADRFRDLRTPWMPCSVRHCRTHEAGTRNTVHQGKPSSTLCCNSRDNAWARYRSKHSAGCQGTCRTVTCGSSCSGIATGKPRYTRCM